MKSINNKVNVYQITTENDNVSYKCIASYDDTIDALNFLYDKANEEVNTYKLTKDDIEFYEKSFINYKTNTVYEIIEDEYINSVLEGGEL